MKHKPPSSVNGIAKNDPDIQAGKEAVENADWPAVVKIAQKRLRKSAIDAFGHRYLGLALEGLGKPQDSIQAYERALKIHPRDVAVLINFSNVLSGQGLHQRAYDLAKRATVLEPKMARAWVTLLWPCYLLGKHQEAVNAAQTAKALPMTAHERVLLLNNLSTNLRDLGRLDEALMACREAIGIAPDWSLPYINLLLFLQSSPTTVTQDILDAAKMYAHRFEEPFKPQWPTFLHRDRTRSRKIRVAFLSPDYNQHPVMYFVEGLFAQLDRQQFEVVAIYLQHQEDHITQRVKRHVDAFHHLATLDDKALAERITAMEIDVLVDLAGHTASSGLRAMRFKPAPVQATWLGYPGTTGLSGIDWRFTDGVADRPGADQEYTEKLYRLPDVFCAYRPCARNPLLRYQPEYQVRQAPAMASGTITFGSCNNLSKLTDTVITTWAQILANVPNSRILIEGKGLIDDEAKLPFKTRCVSLGIPADRLELIDRDAQQQYLTYHRIDIALDSFPLTGGNTTLDLLWMGVPMVTMNGESFRSRIGVTMLECLGRQDWIAQDIEDYVRIACQLAKDIPLLDRVRMTQRRDMERSPLMNESRFTRQFEVALRAMWHHWCGAGADVRPEEGIPAVNTDTSTSGAHQPGLHVTIGTGQRIPLSEAHTHLQGLTDRALAQAPRDQVLAGHTSPPEVTHPAWVEVFEFASMILDAIPNEALALATLAEIEHAHGRTQFSASYLHYAQQALSG